MKNGRRTALEVLREHPQSAALCERVADVCLVAAERRAPEFLSGPAVADAPTRSVIANQDAVTELGNPIEILDRGAETEPEWSLLGAAVSLHVARSLGASATEETERLLSQCTWLATETACNPWLFLEACLQPSQAPLWQAIGDHVLAQSHASQVVLATSLIGARSPDALQVKQRWLLAASSPTVTALLELGTPSSRVRGQLQAAPRSGMLLVLQFLTGYLLVRSLVRVLGRTLLRARSDAELTLSPRGLELLHQPSLMGVPLRERRTWIPLDQLLRVSQETRYHSAALYAGLLGLGAGTYWGSELFWDGLRVPGLSPTLLGWGLLLLLLGLVTDFGLSYVARRQRGQVRLLIVQRRGRTIAMGCLEPDTARKLLEQLVELRAFERAGTGAALQNTPGKSARREGG
jgi:hypothetical protein